MHVRAPRKLATVISISERARDEFRFFEEEKKDRARPVRFVNRTRRSFVDVRYAKTSDCLFSFPHGASKVSLALALAVRLDFVLRVSRISRDDREHRNWREAEALSISLWRRVSTGVVVPRLRDRRPCLLLADLSLSSSLSCICVRRACL